MIEKTRSLKEGINAEYSLAIKAIRDAETDALKRGSQLTMAGQPFVVDRIEREGVGQNLVNIQANHISYLLNDSALVMESVNGFYTPDQFLDMALAGTGFTRSASFTGPSTEFRLSKVSRREAVLTGARFFNAEVVWDQKTVRYVSQRGQDRGVKLAYRENLKGIRQIESKEGIGYAVDFLELVEFDPSKVIELGDTVTVQDETIPAQVKLRVLSKTQDPIRPINSQVEIGQREPTFAEIYEAAMQEEIKDQVAEEVSKIKPEAVVYNQIVEVTKETVLAAETIHATTAWIEELEVNYLRTNFTGRMESAGKWFPYIEAINTYIRFCSGELSATEKEPYKTLSGRTLYWTAIGDHPDAYKYFTLQAPQIPEPKPDPVTGVTPVPPKPEDFLVMVPKLLKSVTLMEMTVEPDQETGNILPMMTWGQGDGMNPGSNKFFMTKEFTRFVLNYQGATAPDGTADYGRVYVGSDGVKVEQSKNQGTVRNFWTGTDAANPPAGMAEGDILLIMG